MSEFDLRSRLLKGRDQSHLSGLDPRFTMALQRLYAAAPPNVQQGLMLNSGFRSVQRQQQLFADAVSKYGSEAAARKWVAPPGRSQHNHGNAMDLKFADPSIRQWVHQNAQNYGIHFPLKHENWHAELVGARGKAGAPSAPGPAPGVATLPSAAPQMPMTALAGMFGDPMAAPSLAQPQIDIAAQQRARQEDERKRTAALMGIDPMGGMFG